MSVPLVCNYRKCRTGVSGSAWVTSCSHAFCAEHGARHFRRGELRPGEAYSCPACGTELRDKFDVIRADLEPSEAFKSIVLAGLKPDVVVDVAMRAISFWSYQVEQETLYQEAQAKHAREKLQCMEEINSLNLQKLKAELQNSTRKFQTLQAECNKKRKQTEELTATLEDKNRRIQKLSFQLESQKRKGRDIHVTSDPDMDTSRKEWSHREDFATKKVASNNFMFRPSSSRRDIPGTPKTTMFDFSTNNSKYPNFQFKPK